MKRPLSFIMSETFESWTPEDVEHGEAGDRGFNFEEVEYEREEIQDYLEREGFIHPSQSPITPDAAHLWISTQAEVEDYGTGEETIKSLHCKKVLDGDGKELTSAQADRAWNKLVAEAAGQKLKHPAVSHGPSM